MTETKICRICGDEKSVFSFSKDNKAKDKLHSSCKECDKQYAVENKTKIAERHKQYVSLHRAEISERQKLWREENKDALCESKKKYADAHKEEKAESGRQHYISNKDTYIERANKYSATHKNVVASYKRKWQAINKETASKNSKRWRDANKDLISAKGKRWKEEHPEERRLHWQKREARKRNLLCTFTVEQWEGAKTYFQNTCCYCGEVKTLHQDHFLALSNNGEYTRYNIIPACQSCNCSKHTKRFSEWYPKQIYYSPKREQRILEYLNYMNGTQQLALF